ncbi:Uncharacterized protein APZ42_011541 [Daphnia magna]|uniref:Uncharacterized protein n=1 Tax=Daphnia magna TaxID=35525 RepID=A0A162SRN0_9CRUS|nr:Uncharacterized protein APZ42_011541 [Daphnia magna]
MRQYGTGRVKQAKKRLGMCLVFVLSLRTCLYLYRKDSE